MSNASQQQNSLLTGKLTGKNAKLCVARQGGSSSNAAFMGLLGSIPCENYQGMFFAEQGNSYPVTGEL
jgi:hypothetical protein